MGPLTKLAVESRVWLGRLIDACTVASEVLALAEQACCKAATFTEREHHRRSGKARATRTR